jgi:tetratricopeptide (TPR) repeat protein
LLAAAGFLRALRKNAFFAALPLVTFAMAVTSRRFIPLFAVTAAPLVAISAAAAMNGLRKRLPVLNGAWVRYGILGVALVLAVFFWRDVRIHPDLLKRWTGEAMYPDAAVRYLKALGPPKKVLNYYGWGGYVMLHAPEVRVFIDGRANTLYDDAFYLDYLRIEYMRPGYRTIIDRHRPDAALFPVKSKLVKALRYGPNPWALVYADTFAAILVPPYSTIKIPKPPPPATIVGDHPHFYMSQAQKALKAGNPEEAIGLLERILEREPLQVPVYRDLTAAYAARPDLPAIEALIEKGIQEFPRVKPLLREYEGEAYLKAGAPEQALRAFRQSLYKGPLASPAKLQNRIRLLEQRIGQQKNSYR